LLISFLFIDKTLPEIIKANVAVADWLRVLQLYVSVSHHEFVTKLIMQKMEHDVHLHHQQRPAYAKACASAKASAARGRRTK
jgi:hypothetical protein